MQGTLVELEPGAGNSIDHWSFTIQRTATVTFDLLSYENPADVTEGGAAGTDVDLNDDQEIAYFDPKIYIFQGADGSLVVGDALFVNDDDDASAGLADGSLIVDSEEPFDSYLEVELLSGSYVLTVGTWNFALEDNSDLIIEAEAQAHIDGSLNAGPFPTLFGPNGASSDHGDYQVTFGEGISVPEAGARMMNVAALLSVVAAALRRKKSASRRCGLERDG